jgi:hypothetical protein
MPYQVNGQAVATKSQRLSQGAGAGGEAGAAAGGGALVTMSAALAALSGVAMSNAKTPAMPSEVTFMVSPSEGSSLPGEFLQYSRSRGRSKLVLESHFRDLLQLEHSLSWTTNRLIQQKFGYGIADMVSARVCSMAA